MHNNNNEGESQFKKWGQLTRYEKIIRRSNAECGIPDNDFYFVTGEKDKIEILPDQNILPTKERLIACRQALDDFINNYGEQEKKI